MTNKELLELEQEHMAEKEARENETAWGRENKNPSPRKFTVKDVAEAFVNLNKLLKCFENMDSSTKRF